MLLEAGLEVTIAQRSEAGRKETNEDSMGAMCPEVPALLAHKGVVAVIADGVSTAEAGREAAELCVKTFLGDYYSTPETWSVETSSRKVLNTINEWLYAKGQHPDAHRGHVSTLSVLVLKSRTAYVFHVGDTRVQLWRDGKLRRLTRDHTVQVSGTEKYLARAMGFDTKVEVDLQRTSVEEGDVFLLTSDGIHDHVSEAELEAWLSEAPGRDTTQPGDRAKHEDTTQLEHHCGRLIRLASEQGSQDNLTCQLLRVDRLPDASAAEYVDRLGDLPFPPELSPGAAVDGFVVREELHASRRSQLYLVEEPETQRLLVMKTPSVNYVDDPAYIERFLLEDWVGRRVKSRHLQESVEPPAHRSYLYSLREYLPGKTLAEWIATHHRRGVPLREVGEVIRLVGECVRGLIALHRREVLHQDLKPGNVIVSEQGKVTLIDYGSCAVAGIDEIAAPIARDEILGTASYSAPEYALRLKPSSRSDLFSLGCLTYEMLTGQLPYGEGLEQARTPADFERLCYVPASQRNPHVPIWMDRAIERAVRIRAEERYAELTEFIYDLENPNPDYLGEATAPLLERASAGAWRLLALVLLFTQALTLYLLLGR